MVDPVTQGFISPSVALKQGGGNMFAKLTGLPIQATLGLVSAGAACDMLVFHLVRKQLCARSHPSTVQQQVQPDSASQAANKFPQQVVHQLVQLPLRVSIVAFAALVGLGCGASRRRKRKLDSKNLREGKFLPLKSMEQDEPDAEPKRRTWWTSIPGKDLRRTMSDLLGTSPTASVWESRKNSRPVVPMKSILPRHPVASIDDEPEEEDSAGIDRGSAPGSRGFVAQQKAEVERVIQFFRMNTEGQLHLLNEEGLEQLNRESQVVPPGLVHSNTAELERQIQRNPVVPRAWSVT